ncbi:DUF5641 domain-containing protein [Trichonephila clavipes]|nr:DUF5641 domain-containing protein [Trichonephila clavipes]
MCQVKDLPYSSSTEIKTLGLLWKPHPDSFAFKISPMTSNCDNLIVTKKSVISTIARIFDPLGLIGLIVLAWIKKPLAQLKTFVRNRVSIIQELTESDFWKHVNSENNPADILSRGISPDKIQPCQLWWFGPPFLHQYKELEPYDITAVEGDDLFLQELKETSDFHLCALLKNFEPLDIISNCSSFTKLQRVIAWFQIEAVLNSRPICPLSNDPNDVETLTPAHFLVGPSLVAVPDPDYTEIPMNRLSRWQLVQSMNQHFWRKWSSE